MTENLLCPEVLRPRTQQRMNRLARLISAKKKSARGKKGSTRGEDQTDEALKSKER